MDKYQEFKGYYGEFAKRLRAVMDETKTTQERLAKQTGLTRQTISQYMDGSVLPNVEKLYKICIFFDIPSDYFLGLTDSKSFEIEDKYIQNQIGLTDEVIQKLRILSGVKPKPGALFNVRSDFDLGVINFILSNSFWSDFSERLREYYKKREDDDTSKDADIAKYLISKLVERLLDDVYNDFYEPTYLKRKIKRKPGRVRKSEVVDKKEEE